MSKYNFQLAECLRIAANGSRLCAVWKIEKQILNYAEKFI